MRKLTTALVVTLALLGIACGSAPKDEVTTGQPAGSGGATAAATKAAPAEMGPKKFAVGQVANLSMANGSTGDVVVNTVKVQGKFIVANVTITCTEGTLTYNVFDWSMIAGDGTKLDPGFAPEVKNGLSSGDLGKGQKITGNTVFQGTAAQAKGAQVQYTATFETLAYWVNP